LVKIVGIVIGLVSIIFTCVCTSHKSGNEKQSYKSRLINGEYEIKMKVMKGGYQSGRLNSGKVLNETLKRHE
jgi:hypothetical protein